MILNVGKKATQVLLALLIATSFSGCGKKKDSQQANLLAAPTQPRAQQLQEISARVISTSSLLKSALLHSKAEVQKQALTSSFHLDLTQTSEQLIGAVAAVDLKSLRTSAKTTSGENVECSSVPQSSSTSNSTSLTLSLNCRGMEAVVLLSRLPLAQERLSSMHTLQALNAEATLTLHHKLQSVELTLLNDAVVVTSENQTTRYVIDAQQRQSLLSAYGKISLRRESSFCQHNQCSGNAEALSLQLSPSGELLMEMNESSSNTAEVFAYSPHRSLRVASYNVENFWDDDPHNSSAYDDFSEQFSNWYSENLSEKKARRIRAALIAAGLPEVVGLQEIESAANKSRSLELLKPVLSELGYNHYALGLQGEDNPTAVTTAVISKFPLAENTRIDFVFKPGELKSDEQNDFISSSRDPQRVSVVLPEGTVFTLLNSHWKSKRDKSPWGDKMRRALAELMREHIENLRSADGNSAHAIIMGDFNADYREEPVYAGLRLAQSMAEARAENNPHKLIPLWLTLSASEQGDYPHDSHFQALDNIIITRSLLKEGPLTLGASLQVVGRSGYASKTLGNGDGLPMRSQLRKYKDSAGQMRTTHFDMGFSDHLPLVAHFKRNIEANESARETLFSESIESQRLTALPQIEIKGTSCAGQSFRLAPGDLANLKQGECVEFQQVALEMQKTGLHNIYVQFQNKTENARATEKVIITADRAFGANKAWLRGTLQSSAGKTLKFVRGRVGYVEGYKAIFIHSPSVDVAFE